MTQISPGVYSSERDLSQYVTDLSSTTVGMVGTSDKGPTNKATFISSQSQFIDVFGNLNPKHYLGYAALQYLSKGSALWVTRVSASDATKAKSAFLLPKSYTNYEGNWTLSGQTATALTLDVADYDTATDKVIVLDPATAIENFDPTDTTNAASANGKLGADFGTFVDYKTNIIGNTFTVTVGAGKGVTASIKDLAGTTSAPKVVLSPTAFTSANSPATAYAAGSVSFGTLLSWTPLVSPNNQLLTVGNSSVATGSLPIDLVYGTAGTSYDTDAEIDALVVALNSTTESVKLNALETLLTGVTTSVAYAVTTPIYDPSVADNAVKNNSLVASILSALAYVVNKSTVPSQAKCAVIYADARYQVSTGVYGLGSVDALGNSRGFKSVLRTTDSLGNVISVILESLVQGFLGSYTYVSTNAPSGLLIIKNQVVSGSFKTGAYRPTWNMISAGASFVPTVIKIVSLGESDLSNTAVTIGFDAANKQADGTQNYSLKVYQRITSTSVPVNSVAFNDFTLVEQFDGSIEAIQSSVESSSRRISVKIDYTTSDLININTGEVVPGVVETDNLVFYPVLATSENGIGVAGGTTFNVTTTVTKQLNTFMLSGSVGTGVTKYDVIGDTALGTGIYSFANAEGIDVNLIMAPGWSADPAVAKALVNVCTNRGDCFSVIDTPFGLTVQEAVDYRDNILQVNSSYGAIYYPWVKISDAVNKKDIFVPPSGQVIAQYAYTDKVADVHYAPAGRNRGVLDSALAAERILTQGDRDLLYTHGINPIHTEAGFGIYIKGQKTLQTQTTALDRVNVRRLFLKLRKVVATASKAFEFEPGDSITTYRLKQITESLLTQELNKGSIDYYNVDVGPNVNTVLTKENNELRMQVSVRPVKTAEIIFEIFSILPQGGVTVLNS